MSKPFTEFTGLEMLKIDIANTYGLDKELYEDRIKWVDALNYGTPIKEWDEVYEKAYKNSSEPLLFHKAIRAYTKAMKFKPTGHNMFMDATASGLQIMAALSRDPMTAKYVNLVDSSKRYDAYTEVTEEMIRRLPDSKLFEGLTHKEIRSLVKKPIMTHYYNSQAKPKEIFGEGTKELETFYDVLDDMFPGAESVLSIINDYWNPNAYEHTWTLPDGHVCKVKVIDKVETRIEAEELSVNQINYTCYYNQPSDNGRSLAPNIIHSIDAYIAREMVRRAKKQGFELAHIHDAFTCHPNHMTKAMVNYREILAEISEMNLLDSILSEISGKHEDVRPYKYDLAADIRKSEYALS